LYMFLCVTSVIFFFFSSRRRHTISKRDWSSDVCSSDLNHTLAPHESILCLASLNLLLRHNRILLGRSVEQYLLHISSFFPSLHLDKWAVRHQLILKTA